MTSLKEESLRSAALAGDRKGFERAGAGLEAARQHDGVEFIRVQRRPHSRLGYLDRRFAFFDVDGMQLSRLKASK